MSLTERYSSLTHILLLFSTVSLEIVRIVVDSLLHAVCSLSRDDDID